MIIKSDKDIEGLQAIGQLVARTVQEMKRHARPGITTLELDHIGARYLEAHGAASAPKTVYDFPGYTCISINQEVAHGIPGERVLQPGDLVNIDVSAVKEGYYADTGHSFVLEPAQEELVRLCTDAYETMMKVIGALRHGVRLNEVGRIIQEEARARGRKVISNLCSHGIGRGLHEPPKEILPTYSKGDHRILKEGQVLTIEPFLSTGADYVVEQADGWTLMVPDNSFVAQHEHTFIVTKDEPLIVTLP